MASTDNLHRGGVAAQREEHIFFLTELCQEFFSLPTVHTPENTVISLEPEHEQVLRVVLV